MNGIETVAALRSAFDALSGVAAPDQVAPVLRQALLALLTTEEPAPEQKSAAKKPRSPWTGDHGAWAPLRNRILAALNACGISRRGLAAELGIPYNTLRPSLLPHGRCPSQANIERLQHWLKTTEIQTAAEGRANGHAAEEVAAPRCSVHKLTVAQREMLAGYRQLDEQTVRHQAGVTPEVIDEAVAGHSLAPELVDRLVKFLSTNHAVKSASS